MRLGIDTRSTTHSEQVEGTGAGRYQKGGRKANQIKSASRNRVGRGQGNVASTTPEPVGSEAHSSNDAELAYRPEGVFRAGWRETTLHDARNAGAGVALIGLNQ